MIPAPDLTADRDLTGARRVLRFFRRPDVWLSILLLLFVGRVVWGNLEPDYYFPKQNLPNPNAFAETVYAAELLNRDGDIGKAIGLDTRDQFTAQDRAELVRANDEALRALRATFDTSYMEVLPSTSPHQTFPHYAHYRGLARLLVLEGTVNRERGDNTAALNSYLEAVYFGERIPAGGATIARLVGIACQTIGRRSAWEQMDSWSGVDAAMGAKRLERIRNARVPLADTFAIEWLFNQSLLQVAFNDPVQAAGRDEDNEPSSATVITTALYLQGTYLVYPKRRIFHEQAHFMDQLIEQTRNPYGLQPEYPAIPPDPLSRTLLDVYKPALFKAAMNDAQNDLLMLALALRAHRATHGRYPDRLDDLAPRYLRSIPFDPFSGEKPYGYRRDGDKYVLYSIGPNGRDDGGRPVETQGDDEVPPGRYTVSGDSDGDIVAGVNTL